MNTKTEPKANTKKLYGSIEIKEPYKTILPEQIMPLKIFARKKDAVIWCKDNGIRPASIQMLTTRFQRTYALNMGHNCFLLK